ncbi:MAG: DnaJ family molecular chaperone [Proteobacteria bacterium]|nr:DnaJ family molecular chaperone [Pseudomonadota bacterium]
MSIWSAISDTASGLGDSVSHFLAGFSRKATAPEKSVAFTIGMIALGAKMARADGIVTKDEVFAFREVFRVPEKDLPAVQRVFDLAKQDVTGFESYAKQVAKLFAAKAQVLENVLDGLFHIAKADHAIHEDELAYLERVAEIFGFKGADFARIRARHVTMADDPYEILGLERGATIQIVKQRYRKLARELHPDKQVADGVPREMVRLATDRLARINVAYEQIVQDLAA